MPTIPAQHGTIGSVGTHGLCVLTRPQGASIAPQARHSITTTGLTPRSRNTPESTRHAPIRAPWARRCALRARQDAQTVRPYITNGNLRNIRDNNSDAQWKPHDALPKPPAAQRHTFPECVRIRHFPWDARTVLRSWERYGSGVRARWLHNGCTMQALQCSHGAAMVLPWCCHGAATVQPWCSHGAATVLPWCCHGAAMPLACEPPHSRMVVALGV